MQPRSSSSSRRRFLKQLNRRARRQRSRTWTQSEQLEERTLLSAAPFEDGSIMVGAKPGVTAADLESAVNGTQARKLGDYGVFHVLLPEGSEVETAIADYENSELVRYAEPNYIYFPAAAPNDPQADQMYHLNNTGQTGGANDADIDAYEAWDVATDAPDVVVAIIDSGTDIDHEDLAGNIWVNPGETPGNGIDDDNNGYIDDVNGWDFNNQDNDPSDDFPSSHGTHVGGTVGAVGNNGVGVTGVAQNVQLMPLRIFSPGTSTAIIVEAINYSVTMGASVSNNSWGGGGFSQAMYDAIQAGEQADQLFVAAAGNHGGDNDTVLFYPASYDLPNILSVAASNDVDTKAGFSAFGATTVDLAAPGVDILSTYEDNTYGLNSGTSMASPVVAGAAAILRQQSPTSTYQEVKDALMQSVDVVPAFVGRVASNGRLNLDSAIASLGSVRVTILSTSIREDAGFNAATGMVRRFGDATLPLDVTLQSLDTTEVNVPPMVTIPSGSQRAFFPIHAVDDTLFDGTQTVAISASALGLNPDTDTIDVLDVEGLSVTITPSGINETDGPNAATGTVTRTNDDSSPPSILVSTANEILEYDEQGNLLQTIPIDYPGVRPPGQDARDLTVTQSGRVAVYNGNDDAFLSRYDIPSDTWTHRTQFGLGTDPNFVSSGGIGVHRNYVFMTDMEAPDNSPKGLIRFNTATGQLLRFGGTIPGDRMFATISSVVHDELAEIDPQTGAVLNSFPAPYGRGVRDGLAYDGSSLWYLGSRLGDESDDLFQLNPDTGAVIQKYDVGVDTIFDGLAVLNGEVYLLDSFIENRIVVFDPINQQVVRIMPVKSNPGGVNINISGGLAAATDPDKLYVTDTFTQTIYELDPNTATVTDSFDQVLGIGDLGLGVVDGEIYVGTNTEDTIHVYDRSGAFQREIDVPDSIGLGSIGGDDIPGPVPNPFDFVDVSAGLDGVIYGLDQAGQEVVAFDPDTLAYVGQRTLDTPVTAIAVDPFGNLFGSNGFNFIQFDDAGNTVAAQASGTNGIIDLDVSLSGTLLAGTAAGAVVISDTTLGNVPTRFPAGTSPVFVSFSSAPGASAADLVVTLTNDDPTEISIPATVTIPAGEQSVSFPIDAVDDAIVDGTQTATITPSAPGYLETSSDSIDVFDVEDIIIDVDEDDIFENDGPGAAIITVSRSNSDGPFDFFSTLTATNANELTILDTNIVRSTVEIAPQFAIVSDVNVTINLEHGRLGDLDVFLKSPAGTRVELFTDVGGAGKLMTGLVLDDEAPAGVGSGSDPFTGHFQPEQPLSLFDGEDVSGTWTLEITDDTNNHFGILKDWTLDLGGLGFPELEVTLASDKPDEANPALTTITIPKNQVSISLDLDAIDDAFLDGTQTTVISGSATGYVTGNDRVDVHDYETLSISVDPDEIAEDAGPNASVGTVMRSNIDDLSSPLVVSLENNDPSEISIPATVTIPKNALSATFLIDAVDDNKLDGTKRVRITATAAGYEQTADSKTNIWVTDSEPILVVELDTDTVFENQQFVGATVTRTNYTTLANSLSVSLTSSLPSDATVPPTITIPANVESVGFTITLTDNNFLDGDRDITIGAEAAATFSGEDILRVLDHETLSITFNPDQFTEADGPSASVGTLTRNNNDIGSPLTVNLTSSDTSEATVPSSVTIQANEFSVDFFVEAINDSDFDGAQTVTIGATAGGYIDELQNVTVFDHEPAVVTGPEKQQFTPRPTITWDDIPGSTSFRVRIDSLSTGENGVINTDSLPGGSTSYEAALPLANGKYRARVFYTDALERNQPPSKYRQFNVRTAPDFIAPMGLPADNPPEFSWNEVLGAATYELQVNDLTNNRDRVIYERSLTSTSFTPAELASGKYEAFVRAINADGFTGEWAETTFTVLARPEILTPQTGSSWDTQPTIIWTGSEGADHYDVRVHDLTAGVLNIVRDRFVFDTQFTPEIEFQKGHNYRIYVRAVTDDGLEGAWSDSVTTKIGFRPTILSPTSGATTDQFPVFRWTEVFGSKRYDFRVREAGKSANVIRVRNVQGTAYSHTTALESGKTYRVWVRSVSTLGQKTRWASPVEFTVASVDAAGLPQAPALAPADTVAPAQDALPQADVLKAADTVLLAKAEAGDAAEQVVVAAEAATATVGVVSYQDQPAEIDAVMEQLPTMDTDWWAVELDETEIESTVELDEFAADVTHPSALAAGAILGLALPTRRRRRKQE